MARRGGGVPQNGDHGETGLQFQQILQSIRDQGERQTGALESLAVEIRDLAKTIVKGQNQSQGIVAQVKNGGWQSYAIMLTLFAALMAPTWGAMSDTRDDVQTIRAALSELKAIHVADENAMIQRTTRVEEKLVETETQFTCLGDIANLERQHANTVNSLLHQCPTCTAPPRDYWPLANVGRGDGSGKQ